MKTALQIVLFQIGTECFGIETDHIKKIVEGIEQRSETDAYLLDTSGESELHSDIIPVLSLHSTLKMEPFSKKEKKIYIVLISEMKLVAVPVDKLLGYYTVPIEQLSLVPSIHQNKHTLYQEQMAILNDELIPVFDVERLFEKSVYR